MRAAEVAESLWHMASGTHPGSAVVYELHGCDCGGGHAAHSHHAHVLADDAAVLGFCGDFHVEPGAVGAAVWCGTSRPEGGRMLLVVCAPVAGAPACTAACVVGRDGQFQVLQAMWGPLLRDVCRAVEPVGFDDPLVAELASLTRGDG